MTIINKILGNPAIIGAILVVILTIIFFFVWFPVANKHKWILFFVVVVSYTILIPSTFMMYEYAKSYTPSISGGFQMQNDVFTIPEMHKSLF